MIDNLKKVRCWAWFP